MHKSIFVILIPLLLYVCKSRAETNVVLTALNSEAQRVTVGKLVPDREPSPVRLILTDSGYLLPIYNSGFGTPWVTNPIGTTGNQFYNTVSNCSGTTFLDAQNSSNAIKLKGFIKVDEQVSVPGLAYRVNWNTDPQNLLAAAEIDADGVCQEIFIPFAVTYAMEVEEVDLSVLGLFWDSGVLAWRLSSPLWEVRLNGTMFCNGFENCPN